MQIVTNHSKRNNMKNSLQLPIAMLILAGLSSCGGGGGSAAPQVTGCCQTEGCKGSTGGVFYVESCTFTKVSRETTIVGHPMPNNLICTADKAVWGCQ